MDWPILSIHDEEAAETALGNLRNGGVVVLPTDTIYGFSAAISSIDGVRRIAELKASSEIRRYILLGGSIDMVERYVYTFGSISRDDLARIWPAPLTGVFPAGKACPPWTGPTVAFRVPDFPLLLDLLNDLGEPVVSTSVNVSGGSPLNSVDEISDVFGSSVDLILSGKAPRKKRPPKKREAVSTIVDFTSKHPVVIREGLYVWDAGGGNPSK